MENRARVKNKTLFRGLFFQKSIVFRETPRGERKRRRRSSSQEIDCEARGSGGIFCLHMEPAAAAAASRRRNRQQLLVQNAKMVIFHHLDLLIFKRKKTLFLCMVLLLFPSSCTKNERKKKGRLHSASLSLFALRRIFSFFAPHKYTFFPNPNFLFFPLSIPGSSSG